MFSAFPEKIIDLHEFTELSSVYLFYLILTAYGFVNAKILFIHKCLFQLLYFQCFIAFLLVIIYL